MKVFWKACICLGSYFGAMGASLDEGYAFLERYKQRQRAAVVEPRHNAEPWYNVVAEADEITIQSLLAVVRHANELSYPHRDMLIAGHDAYIGIGIIASLLPRVDAYFDDLAEVVSQLEEKLDISDPEKLVLMEKAYLAIGRFGFDTSIHFFASRIDASRWDGNPPVFNRAIGNTKYFESGQTLALLWIGVLGEDSAYEYLERMRIELDVENNEVLDWAYRTVTEEKLRGLRAKSHLDRQRIFREALEAGELPRLRGLLIGNAGATTVDVVEDLRRVHDSDPPEAETGGKTSTNNDPRVEVDRILGIASIPAILVFSLLALLFVAVGLIIKRRQ